MANLTHHDLREDGTTELGTHFAARGNPSKYKEGDKIFAAWWTDLARKTKPDYYPGVIMGCGSVEKDGQHVPTGFYSILFTDGDQIDHLHEEYIFPRIGKANQKSGWQLFQTEYYAHLKSLGSDSKSSSQDNMVKASKLWEVLGESEKADYKRRAAILSYMPSSR